MITKAGVEEISRRFLPLPEVRAHGVGLSPFRKTFSRKGSLRMAGGLFPPRLSGIIAQLAPQKNNSGAAVGSFGPQDEKRHGCSLDIFHLLRSPQGRAQEKGAPASSALWASANQSPEPANSAESRGEYVFQLLA